jgi:hypothetical protein
MSFWSNPGKAIKSSLGGIGGGVIGTMLLPGIGTVIGAGLGQSLNSGKGKRRGNPDSQAIVPAGPPPKSSQFLANEQVAENLRNKLYADKLALKSSNYPVYKGETNAPMSLLTQKARMLREEGRNKPAPYSKKVEAFMKKEGTGFSPEQTRSLLDMINRGGKSSDLAQKRLQKQFGSNYGYEDERAERLKGKLEKDNTRSEKSTAANFKNLNREFADVENRRNVDVARSFHDAGAQKGLRRNALVEQLEEFGNQDHALNNLQNRAKRDVFDEEYETPYRKIAATSRALDSLGPEDDHPDKTEIRNKELQRIQNAYNAPHVNYPGKRVIGMQPETLESFNRAESLSPKYKDAYHGERKAIERNAINNSLPNQVFNAIPESVDPMMKNIDNITKQQLKKQSKEIAGKHVRLGSYGSGSHKAETEKALREILRRVRQEREGAVTGVAKGEASLATRKEQTGLMKHKMMDLLGSQEFGNVLDKNKQLNKLGWDKRSNKQSQENEALKAWYSQLQHGMGGVDVPGYTNLAKQYDTDLQGLFNKPQNYNENAKAFETYKNSTKQGIGDVTSRKQLEDWEDEQRRMLMGGYSPKYGSSQNNLKAQAYALAKATPVY